MTKARDLASAAPAPSTVSATELGYLDGVTSGVQAQIDSKLATTTASSTYEPLLPSQTGNSGKYLTTDGTNKSWGTITIPPNVSLKEQIFTSTTTFTLPTGTTSVWIGAVGGGGGGGGSYKAGGYSSGGGGGAGDVKEEFITISGDTSLIVTIGAGGSGGVGAQNGTKGGSTTIVGSQTSTTYLSCEGGGYGAGGSATKTTGGNGASGGGTNDNVGDYGGAGGGAGGLPSTSVNGSGNFKDGGGQATTDAITGYDGSNGGSGVNGVYGGIGVSLFNNWRVAGGGSAAYNGAYNGGTSPWGGGGTISSGTNSGYGNAVSATANTGSGGGGAAAKAGESWSGGNGGSGFVVIRYVG